MENIDFDLLKKILAKDLNEQNFNKRNKQIKIQLFKHLQYIYI